MSDPADSLRLAIRLFNSGYQHGHEDTVESQFTLIHYSDQDTYHEEKVLEILSEWECHKASTTEKGAYSTGWNAALAEARRQIQDFALQAGLDTKSSAAECDRVIQELIV